MTDTAQLLSTLRDVREPVPPEATPLWHLATSALMLLGMILLLLFLWHRRRSRWLTESLGELEKARALPPDAAVTQIARLLRKVALYFSDNPEHCSQLTGDAWLEYLDQLFSTSFFTAGEGRIFGDRLYGQRTTSDLDTRSLVEQVRKVIKRKRFASKPGNRRNNIPPGRAVAEQPLESGRG